MYQASAHNLHAEDSLKWKTPSSYWSYKEPPQMEPLNWVCIKNSALKEHKTDMAQTACNAVGEILHFTSLSVMEQTESESLSQFACVL